MTADLETLAAADRPTHWREAPVTVSLRFGFADMAGTVPAVIGTVSVTLDVVCQRCLEPFQLPLELRLQHVLLPAGEPAPGVDDHEVWELTGDEFRPQELVEEALIMALPLSAAHAEATLCGPLAQFVADERRSRRETVRPFADLREKLKELK